MPVSRALLLRLFARGGAMPARTQPRFGPATHLGAVAFIHRFGSTLNPSSIFTASAATACSTLPPRAGVMLRGR